MTDAELDALAALVQIRFAQAALANQDRQSRDWGLAYGEDWTPPELCKLENELRRRGVIG